MGKSRRMSQEKMKVGQGQPKGCQCMRSERRDRQTEKILLAGAGQNNSVKERQ